jgi:hypothetical protein
MVRPAAGVLRYRAPPGKIGGMRMPGARSVPIAPPIAQPATDNEAVFVAGYPRSGTTLLYRLLSNSPEFASVRDTGDSSHETAISVYSNPLLDLASVYRQVWPDWRRVISDADRFDALARRTTQLSPIRRAWEELITRFAFRDGGFLNSPLDVDSLAVRGLADPAGRATLRRLAMRTSRRKDVLRGFVDLYTEQARAARMLEKYPFNYYRFVELSVALPSARFVFLVRDPSDVFASMVRRARVELQDRIPIGRVSWMILSADTFVLDWLGSVRAARAFARRSPERIRIVRYEDLTTRPVEVLSSVADFLGLAPEPLLAEAGVNETPDSARRFPLRTSAPTPNTGRYLDEIAEADLATIRRGCARVLSELGYPA